MTETVDGQVLTEIETKTEIHPAATVFILSDEENPRALLLKHKKLGVWLPAGGHQGKTETPHEAAIREAAEETGIDISPYLPSSKRLDDRSISLPIPSHILLEDIPARGDQPAHRHQDMIFVVRVPFQEAIRAEQESDDLRWFGKDELDELEMFSNVKDLLVEIFDSLNSTQESEE